MARAISAAVAAGAGRRSASATRHARGQRICSQSTLKRYTKLEMRFVTIQRLGYTEPGVLIDGEVIGIRGAGFDNVISVIGGGADAMDRVRRWADNPPGGERLDAADAKLAAPIPR